MEAQVVWLQKSKAGITFEGYNTYNNYPQRLTLAAHSR